MPLMAQDDMPVQGMRVPLKLYPDGSVRTEFKARSTSAPEGGDVVAHGVEITMYAPDGSVATKLEAEECVFNRAAGTATSQSRVRLERPGVVVTGVGMRWDAAAETLTLLTESRVELSRVGVGPLLPGRELTKERAQGDAP